MFGRLTPIARAGTIKHPKLLCVCECGEIKEFLKNNLESGRTQSCGCLNKELVSKRCFKHGSRANPEYVIWCAMIERCEVPNTESFKYYGARGIQVCERWRNSFIVFLEDMGPRPAGRRGNRPEYSIERINNDGNYEPSNCKWATWEEQVRNKRGPGIKEQNHW